MQKRFIGPENSRPVYDGKGKQTGTEDAGHEVTVAGRSIGTVRHGDVLEVPDEVAKGVAWAESLWEDVKAAPARRERTGN